MNKPFFVFFFSVIPILNVIDIYTTVTAISLGGIEMNPFMVWHINTVGLKGAMIVKFLIVNIAILIIADIFFKMNEKYPESRKTFWLSMLCIFMVSVLIWFYAMVCVGNFQYIAILKH